MSSRRYYSEWREGPPPINYGWSSGAVPLYTMDHVAVDHRPKKVSILRLLTSKTGKKLKGLQGALNKVLSAPPPSTTATPSISSSPPPPIDNEMKMMTKGPLVGLLLQLAPTISKALDSLSGPGSLYALKKESLLAKWRFKKALFIGVPESLLVAKLNLPSTLVSGGQKVLQLLAPPPEKTGPMELVAAGETSSPNPKTRGEVPIEETVSMVQETTTTLPNPEEEVSTAKQQEKEAVYNNNSYYSHFNESSGEYGKNETNLNFPPFEYGPPMSPMDTAPSPYRTILLRPTQRQYFVY